MLTNLPFTQEINLEPTRGHQVATNHCQEKKYILKFFSGGDHMTFEGGVGGVFSKSEHF